MVGEMIFIFTYVSLFSKVVYCNAFDWYWYACWWPCTALTLIGAIYDSINNGKGLWNGRLVYWWLGTIISYSISRHSFAQPYLVRITCALKCKFVYEPATKWTHIGINRAGARSAFYAKCIDKSFHRIKSFILRHSFFHGALNLFTTLRGNKYESFMANTDTEHACGQSFHTNTERWCSAIGADLNPIRFTQRLWIFWNHFWRDFGIGTFASTMRYWSVYWIADVRRLVAPMLNQCLANNFTETLCPLISTGYDSPGRETRYGLNTKDSYSHVDGDRLTYSLRHFAFAVHFVFAGISFRQLKTPEWLHPFERITFESMNHTAPCERRGFRLQMKRKRNGIEEIITCRHHNILPDRLTALSIDK